MSDLTSPPIEFPRPVEVFVVQPQRRRWWLHILLLLVTLLTTTIVGARLQYNFANNLPVASTADDALPMFPLNWIVHHPSRLVGGLPFSLSLMLILMAHEMGHYLYCERYGVRATLPYFIPAPTLIGTLGAFIKIKSPMRSRNELFDIGIAGPIAGFVFAMAVLFISLPLSKPLSSSAASSELAFGYPLIFHAAHKLFGMFSSTLTVPLRNLYIHPMAMAAWVGMFATSLNLLPGGQLDGGHIVYALRPKWHRWISRLTIVALVPMALFYWAGWLLWAILLFISGMRHPRLPMHPDLNSARRRWGLVAILLLILTLTPAPFLDSGILSLLHK